ESSSYFGSVIVLSIPGTFWAGQILFGQNTFWLGFWAKPEAGALPKKVEEKLPSETALCNLLGRREFLPILDPRSLRIAPLYDAYHAFLTDGSSGRRIANESNAC